MGVEADKGIMKEQVKLKEYYKYKRNLKYWLLFNGTWPITKPSRFYRAIPIVVVTSTITLSILLFRCAIANIRNMSMMVRGFSLGTSFMSIGLKTLLLTVYKNEREEMHEILRGYHMQSLDDNNLRVHVLETVTTFRRCAYLLSFCAASGCFMHFFAPLIFIIGQIQHHVQPIKYILPSPAAYPWDISNGGLFYKLTYIYEAYNTLCLGIVTCGADSLFGYYIFHIIGQFRVMTYQMKNLHTGDNHEQFTREWVDKFHHLRKCCYTLEKIYGPIILWQIVTNSAVICTVLFQIFQATGLSIGKYIVIGGYTGSKIVQTYLYAWAGSALTTESEALMDAVYMSDWVGAGRRRFATSILIILVQRPLKISCVGFVDVSTEMFIMTLNTAVSYFFLLKTFDERQS